MTAITSGSQNGIISDTHGLLRQEALHRFAGVDHIVHGGDIGKPDIIDALRRIAPVTAIRGNVDIGDRARAYPGIELVELAGKSIYVFARSEDAAETPPDTALT